MAKKITEKKAQEAVKAWNDADAQLRIEEGNFLKEVKPKLQDHEKKAKDLEKKKAEAEAILEAYSNQEREVLYPEGTRSVNFLGLTIGYRKGAKKLDVKASTNWDKVLDKCKELFPDFIKNTPKLDKTAILKAVDEKPDEISKLGLKVVQEDKFFVKSA